MNNILDYSKPIVHWVRITVYQPHNRSEIINTILWTNMMFEHRCKWDWYFKYRAALEQIKYPRAKVEFCWGNKPAEGKSLLQIKMDRFASRKREITKISNAITKHEQHMSRLLIWEKDNDVQYQKALSKLERVKNEYHQLEEELKLMMK